jgi:hypothetical protein
MYTLLSVKISILKSWYNFLNQPEAVASGSFYWYLIFHEFTYFCLISNIF